ASWTPVAAAGARSAPRSWVRDPERRDPELVLAGVGGAGLAEREALVALEDADEHDVLARRRRRRHDEVLPVGDGLPGTPARDRQQRVVVALEVGRTREVHERLPAAGELPLGAEVPGHVDGGAGARLGGQVGAEEADRVAESARDLDRRARRGAEDGGV